MNNQSNQSFETEVISRLSKIETKLDDYQKVREESAEALNLSRSNKESINEIKENNKWLWRTVAGVTIAWFINTLYRFIEIVK